MSEPPRPTISGSEHGRAAHIPAAASALAMLRWTGAVAILGFSLSLFALLRIAQGSGIPEALRTAARMPISDWLLAVAAGAGSILCASLYDHIALRQTGRTVPYRHVAFSAIVAVTAARAMGFSALANNALRRHLNAAWGLNAVESVRVAMSWRSSAALGFLLLLGGTFVYEPVVFPEATGVPYGFIRPIGILLLLAASIYFVACMLMEGPFVGEDWQFSLPRGRDVLVQGIASVSDRVLLGSALWVLLPEAEMGFLPFLGVYMVAAAVAELSQVPGGLAVFDALLLVLLRGRLEPEAKLAALIGFRTACLLTPIAVVSLTIGAWSLVAARKGDRPEPARHVRWVPTAGPRILGAAVFAAGVLLLFAAVAPARADTEAATREVALALLCLVGFALLFLARGLQRSLSQAWKWSMALLPVGLVAALAAHAPRPVLAFASAACIGLLPSRRWFGREDSFRHEPNALGWWLIIATVAGGVGMLGSTLAPVASNEWEWLGLPATGTRVLLALALVSVAVAAARLRGGALWRIAPAAVSAVERGPRHGLRALPGVLSAYRASGRFEFRAQAAADVLRFRLCGRFAVSEGGPGPRDSDRSRTAARWLDWCHLHTLTPVMSGASATSFAAASELGLSPFKVGEEGVVDCAHLEGGTRLQPQIARSVRRAEALRASFSCSRPEASPPVGDARRVAAVATLRAGDRALVELHLWAPRPDRLVLSRVITQGEGDELLDAAIRDLLLWAQHSGIARVSLGHCPLSDTERASIGPIHRRLEPMENAWRIALGRVAEREFKSRFSPAWIPRYLMAEASLELGEAIGAASRSLLDDAEFDSRAMGPDRPG